MASRWRSVPTYLASIVIVVGAGVGYLAWQARRANVALEASFRRSLGGRSYPERFPKTEDNATVRSLETLGCEIGLEMAQPKGPGACHPSLLAKRRFEKVKAALNESFNPRKVAEDGSLAPRSAEVAAYLTASRPTLDRVRNVLLSSPPVAWKLDLTEGWGGKVPNTIGFMHLDTLLLARAREEVRNGDREAALSNLEAAWRYNQAVLDSPLLIAQMAGESMTQRQLIVLRSLADAPEPWPRRLMALDLRGRLSIGFRTEAFMTYQTAAVDRPPPDAPIQPWWLARRFLRDHARRFEAMIAEMERRDIRSFDPDEFSREMNGRIPRWQIASRFLLPDHWNLWPRAAHLELAAEATALAWQERTRLSTGLPRDSVSRPSARVRGLRWIFERTPSGTRIRLGGRLQAPGRQPLPLTVLVRTGRQEKADRPGTAQPSARVGTGGRDGSTVRP